MAVWLDDLFPDHPKVVAAGGDAAWLYVCGLCYCRRLLTDGRIPKAAVARLTDRKAPSRLARKLVEVGLWHDDGDHYRVHDWDRHNLSAEAIRARRGERSVARSAAARKAANARWHASDSHANSMPDASSTHDPPHTDRNADAMRSDAPTRPNPLTPHPSSSSVVSHQGVAPDVADDDDSQVETTARLVAERRLSRQPAGSIRNPAAYRRTTVRSVIDEADELIRAMLADGADPESVADAVDGAGQPDDGRCPGCGTPAGSVGHGEDCPMRVEWAEDEHGVVVRR